MLGGSRCREAGGAPARTHRFAARRCDRPEGSAHRGGIRRQCRNNLFRREQPVQRGRKAGIDRHLHDDLDDLLAGKPDIKPRLDMHLELRRGIAERGQRGMVAISRARKSRPGRE